MPSSSSNDNYKTSRDYELLVHKIIGQAMSGIIRVKDLEILHNTKIKGLSGYEHQIDAAYRFKIWKTEILVLVECKQYDRNAGIDDLLEFRSRIEDIKAHKGIFVTSSGFQSGAIRFAEANRIALLVIRKTASVDEDTTIGILESRRFIPPEKECQSLVEHLRRIYKTPDKKFDSRISIDYKRNVVIVRHVGAKIVLKPKEVDFFLVNNTSRKITLLEELLFLGQSVATWHPDKLLKAIILDELLTQQSIGE
jgi:hypothetical protein